MKIDSGKKAVIGGIIYAAVTFFTFLLFTIVLYYLLDREFFVYYDESREIVNGIHFLLVKVIAMILSAIIPVVMLKCNKFDYYGIVLCVAPVIYGIMFIAVSRFSIFMLAEANVDLTIINSFDSLIFGLWCFPFGAVVGISVKAMVHMFMKKE